ncbi:coiled coil [Cryptosporidium xiaoi]|uniref:Coiled coil n=1 Tax=Cryptosporidium xiaoi TaxID=659607 RepID=A0AAV9Y3H5_9CRYT
MHQLNGNPQQWNVNQNSIAGGIPIKPNTNIQGFQNMIPRMGVYSTPHSPQKSANLPPSIRPSPFPRHVSVPIHGMNTIQSLNHLTPTQEFIVSNFTSQNGGFGTNGETQGQGIHGVQGQQMLGPQQKPNQQGMPIQGSNVDSPERDQNRSGFGSKLINSFIPWIGTCGAQSQGQNFNNQNNKGQSGATPGTSISFCGPDIGAMTPDFPSSHDSNYSFSNKVRESVKHLGDIGGNGNSNELEKDNRELRKHLFELGEAVHEYISKMNDPNSESQLIAALTRQLCTIHQKIGDVKYSSFSGKERILINTDTEFVNNIVHSINSVFGKIELLSAAYSNDKSALMFINEMQKSLFEIGNQLEKFDSVYKNKCSEFDSAKNIANVVENDNKHLSERLRESNEQIKMLRERIIVLSTNIEDNNSIQSQTSSPMYKKLEREKQELERKVTEFEYQLQETKKSLEMSEKKYNNLVHEETIKAQWPKPELTKGRSHEDLIEILKTIDPDSKTLQSIAENLVKKDQNLSPPQPTLKDRVINLQVNNSELDHLANDKNIGELHKDTIRMQLEQFQKLHLLNENVNKNSTRVKFAK